MTVYVWVCLSALLVYSSICFGAGDFPNIERFKTAIREYDFSKFPKLDLKYEWQRTRLCSLADMQTLQND